MAKSRGLGRGMDSLIPLPASKNVKADSGAEGGKNATRQAPVEKIKPSPWQPRRHFDEEKIAELAQSIRANGLVQPLVVREKDGMYELIAGERRFRAIRDHLDWKTAPVLVMEAEDARMRELALVENIQRADLNAIEVAVAYQELQKETGLTHDKIAERVGVSRAQVTNTLRLLDLPEEAKRLVAEGKLPAGSARAILGLSNPLAQIRLARKAVDEGLSTRRVEQLAADHDKGKPRAGEAAPRKTASHVAALEERLLRHLGTKVQVEDNQGKGKIIIEYYSVEDAQRLLDRMGLPPE